MTPVLHLLYGTPPRELADIPAGAQQCSPLIPGSLALEDIAPGTASSATLYAPPGTLERRYTLALTLRALAEGGTLIALAPKDKGGSRLSAELEAFGCHVTENSRAHHRIARTAHPATPSGIEDAIAEGGARNYLGERLWTQPGIFSWDRIDEGSALLLAHLPPLVGAGADLGAGLGVLSRAVLQSPAVTALTAIDIDRRAVESARRNLPDPRTQCLWADIRHSAPAAQGLDFVVMNPPFHDTGVEDHALGLAFIARAADMLKAGGTLWCVANRHLPYEAALMERFSHIDTRAQENGYKIITAVK